MLTPTKKKPIILNNMLKFESDPAISNIPFTKAPTVKEDIPELYRLKNTLSIFLIFNKYNPPYNKAQPNKGNKKQ